MTQKRASESGIPPTVRRRLFVTTIGAIPLSILIAVWGVRDGMWSTAAAAIVLVPMLALTGWTAWQLNRPWALQPTRQEEAAPWFRVIGRLVWDALAVFGIATLLSIFLGGGWAG